MPRADHRETGKGKDLVGAHHRMAAAPWPFVAVNCAAIRRAVGERTVRPRAGAFTGAVGERSGAFRDAARDIVLDESGHDFAMQAKSAPFRSDVTPVGAPVACDVRVWRPPSATLRLRHGTVPFAETSSIGSMCADHLAPLRGRLADIIAAGRAFLFRARAAKRLGADAAAHLWPMLPGKRSRAQECVERVESLPWHISLR